MAAFRLIQHFRQRATRFFVLDDSLPFRIAVEFREDVRQIVQKLIALGRGKGADRLFDFLGGAYCSAN